MWSQKEAGLSRNARSSAPPQNFKFIFDLKMASFDALLALLVVFYAI